MKSLKFKNFNNNILFFLVLDSLEKKIFKILKKTFIRVFILIYFNLDYKTQIKINILDYIIAEVLFQKNNKNILKLIIFISYKITL